MPADRVPGRPPDHDPPAADRHDRHDRQVVRMLALVEAAYAAQGGGPAQLVRIDPAGHAIDVALKPLAAGLHPEAVLLGFVAPPEWSSLGVVAEGRAVPLAVDGSPEDPPTAPPRRPAGPRLGEPRCQPHHPSPVDPTPAPAPQRAATAGAARRPVVAAVLARRTGLVVARTRVGRGPGHTEVHRAGGPPPTGRLVDLLRRALGLPSAPPPPATTRLWAVLWLHAVATAAGAAPRLAWDEVAALHPSAGRGGGSLVERALASGSLVTWEALRAGAASGRWVAPGLRDADAAWMDAGAFARWVLDELPPLGPLATAVQAALPAHADRIARVLAGCGLDPVHHPGHRLDGGAV